VKDSRVRMLSALASDLPRMSSAVELASFQKTASGYLPRTGRFLTWKGLLCHAASPRAPTRSQTPWDGLEIGHYVPKREKAGRPLRQRPRMTANG